MLSPGASPIRPPLPGIDLPGIFRSEPFRMPGPFASGYIAATSLRPGWTRTPASRLSEAKAGGRRGGGFIGLEMVENLAHLGLDVTLIEKLNQVMPPLDPEMARLVERIW